MMLRRCATAATLLLAAAGTTAPAQQIIIRDLGPIVATSVDPVRGSVLLRVLPNGSVLASEVARRRVLLFDSTLSHMSVVVDSMTYSTSSSLIPFGRDSTLFVDLASTALLVIDDHGKVARTMSLPKTADMFMVSGAYTYGTPITDAKGRLIYLADFPRVPGVTSFGPAVAARLAAVPDSAPLVRADFETRIVDTIAVLSVVPAYHTVAATLDTTTRPVHMVLKDTFNPLASSDDWVGLSNGSIAIVRAHDYHVDFINPDGSTRSAPKLDYQWRRLSDEEKTQLVDSLRPRMIQLAQQTLAAGVAIPTNAGLRRLAREIEPLPIAQIPDYAPPFTRGLARADLDGNVWTLPRASSASAAGLLYDVVNGTGHIVERVRLPAGRTLAGFGPHGAVFLLNYADGTTHIEQARIR